MNKPYTYGKQCIDEVDVEAVAAALRSDWLTQGPAVESFEKSLSEKLGSTAAAAVSNGTAALHLTALASGWSEGDVVLTTPITFLATANCVLYTGATPDFVDINQKTYTLDVDKLEEKIKYYEEKGKRIRAVIGVDYAGRPCEWKELRFLADKYEFQLINDACHALGASYEKDIRYQAKYADAVILSFHPVKHITTGEGGAALTNNIEFDEKLKALRSHGVTRNRKNLERWEGPWWYEMHEIGFNYRITDFQCILGMNQLKKLDRFVEKRRRIARYYDNVFGNDERFITPDPGGNASHAYHIYPLQIRFETISITKKELFQKLRSKEIFCQVHYIPMHFQPYYRKTYGYRPGDFPIAETFYSREISIPMHPQLESGDLEYIVETVKKLVK